MSETMPLTEVAERLGHNVNTIRAGLRQGRFPFGVALQVTGEMWTYIVPRAAFETFMRLGVQPQITQVVVSEEALPELARVIISRR